MLGKPINNFGCRSGNEPNERNRDHISVEENIMEDAGNFPWRVVLSSVDEGDNPFEQYDTV